MDHETLKQLARLKFTMRQAKLGTLDLERYSTDDDYARRMLEQGEEADNEEIVMLAVELRHKRGLLSTTDGARDDFTDANGAPARHANQQTDAEPEAKQGMMSRMFGRSKPAPSKSKPKVEDDDGDNGKAKYMYGPRG